MITEEQGDLFNQPTKQDPETQKEEPAHVSKVLVLKGVGYDFSDYLRGVDISDRVKRYTPEQKERFEYLLKQLGETVKPMMKNQTDNRYKQVDLDPRLAVKYIKEKNLKGQELESFIKRFFTFAKVPYTKQEIPEPSPIQATSQEPTIEPVKEPEIDFIKEMSSIVNRDFSSIVERILIKRKSNNALKEIALSEFDIPKDGIGKKVMIFFNDDKSKALAISTIKDGKLRAVDNTVITVHNDIYGVFIGIIEGPDGYIEIEIPNNKAVVFNMNGISVVRRS